MAKDQKLEMVCDEIRELTDDGSAEFDLENAGPEDFEDLREQLVSMMDAAENLMMIVHRTLVDVQFSPPKRVGAGRR